MQTSNQSHQVLDLARTRGLLRSVDLHILGIPRVVLSRLTANGQLEKVGRGIYRLPNSGGSENETLSTVAVKVPQAIFCLFTALQFHGLTTQLPRQVCIAMPRGSRVPKMDYPPLKMVQFSESAYSEGIERFEVDKVQLRIYSVAKTVVDCFKFRHRVGVDVAIEALKDALSQNKVSKNDIWYFAKICRVTNVMRPYLDALE